MSAPVLSCKNIVVSYSDGPDTRTVLNNVSLDISTGELVTISGESGSGKSTLLTIVGLLKHPDSGEVEISQITTSALAEHKRTKVRRDHIAFVYQSANLLPSLTAVEQLQMVGHIRGIRPSKTKVDAINMLEMVGLGQHANKLPSQLSGGERQRVGIARALIAKPTLLIADEPTASLDPERANSIAEIFDKATKEFKTATLVVAHDDATRQYSNRHYVLASGILSESK